MSRIVCRLVAGVLLLIVGIGCKSTEPAPLSMLVAGSANMNLGNVARVQVSQLKSDARFMAVPLESFWRDAAAALQEDLIRVEQDFLLYPGTERSFEIVLDDQAAYLGVAVDLREPDGNQWRRVVRTDGLTGRRVRVTVGENRVLIEP